MFFFFLESVKRRPKRLMRPQPPFRANFDPNASSIFMTPLPVLNLRALCFLVSLPEEDDLDGDIVSSHFVSMFVTNSLLKRRDEKGVEETESPTQN